MNILLINHYAGSDRLGMEYRPFYLAREWVSFGHRVTIIAADRSHLRSSQPQVHADLAGSTEEGITYRWIRTPSYVGNGISRVINILAFVAKLIRYARRISQEVQPDIVICSSTYPLDIYPGELIAQYSCARLVFEVHDLWPLTPMLLGGYPRWHPFILLLQRAEDHAYARAGAVVSILPNARSYMVGRGMAAGKFIHIPNGIPMAHVQWGGQLSPSTYYASIIQSERRRGQFLVGYAGSLTPSVDINLLMDAAKLERAAGVSIMIAGDGPRASELRTRLSSLSANNVHLLGRIPKTDVSGFLAAMDALVVPLHRSPLYQYGISPNKVFDYMFAARPIILASDASNDVVSDAECGFTILPGNPDALVEAIDRVRALPRFEQDRLGLNGRRYVCRHHDFRDLAQRFLIGIDRAISAERSQAGNRRMQDAGLIS